MEARARYPGNLGAEAQARRLRVGIVALGVALTVATVMVKMDLPAGYRLLLFIPFLVAANGIATGLFRTSGWLAVRGQRDAGAPGEREPIPSRRERASLLTLGRTVTIIAVVAAALATALFTLLR